MFLFTVPYLKEYLATFGVCLSLIATGSVYGWTSPVLPKLLSPDSHIKITHDEASWIAAFLQLGGIAGSFLSPLLVDRFGRKAALVLSAIPFLVSLILFLVADSYIYLYIARIIGGIATGVVTPCAALYIGEIASKEIRGTLGILLTTSIKFGILLSYSVGYYVSYATFIYILAVVPIVMLTTIFWIPESPIYYLKENREKDAFQSIRYLRPHKNDADIQTELEAMYQLSNQQSGNKGAFKDLFKIKGNRKGLTILMVLFSDMYMSGYGVFLFHSVQVFEEAAGSVDANVSVILLAFIQLAVTVVGSMIVDKIGRRSLLLASLSGIVLANTILGAYFFVKDYLNLDVTPVNWIPITIMIIFILSYSFGLSTVPFILLGELFTTNTKGAASSILLGVTGGLGFFITKLYQMVTDAYGIYVSYWIFGAYSFLVGVTVYFKLLETKGKSLDEIQVLLNK